ncbi:MAG: PEGA domain-containing protein [Telluria sp.]
MMTSQSTTGTLALTRSLRDVVAHQPELVTEVWCRRIFRHILQLLERDYALRRPHAPITPDTLGFDEHGDPALLTADDDTFQPSEAVDVQSLGGVIHYAITLEDVPTMSLRKRGQEGYSESLLTAVDKCLSPNPAERPQTIGELRDLLGIVALGPTIGAPPSPPVFIQPPTPPARGMAGIGKWQRWVMIGLAAIVLLAAGSAFWMLMRGTTNNDNVVLTLPEELPRQAAAPPAPPQARPTPAAPAAPAVPAADAVPASVAPAPVQQAAGPERQAAVPPAPTATAARDAKPAATRRTAAGSAAGDDDITTYKLMIKPWGTVYVDGSERGVSPPLKLLSLPAGHHTVRIVNPSFRDRVIRVSAGKHDSARIDVDFKK